jgi:uncharacterized protein (TIGR02145 family)
MKTRTILLIAMCTMMAGAYAQEASIALTFNAQYQSESIALDSIFIQNLTQGGDTMLYWPETNIALEITTGFPEPIRSSGERFEISQNSPNPFAEMTTVSVFLAEKGFIELTVRNIMGQNIAFHAGTFEAGTHRFTFYPGNDRFYLLSAFFNEETKSIKMISNGSTQTGKVSLEYSGTEQSHPAYKDKSQKGGFVFSLGDQLRFTGYATTPILNIGNDEIEDTPEENQTYTFNIIEGIRCPGGTTVTDTDGNMYNTVLIGAQCWMKENLKATKTAGSVDITRYCYQNNPDWCDIYGGLYKWETIMNGEASSNEVPSGVQGICPTGWHVPSAAEWEILVDYLGGALVAGGKLKSTRTEPQEHPRWDLPNTGATNENGFTALPGGYRYFNNSSYYLGNMTYFFTTTEYFSFAYKRSLTASSASIPESTENKGTATALRCIKD